MTLDPSLRGNNPNSSASLADLIKSLGSLNNQSGSGMGNQSAQDMPSTPFSPYGMGPMSTMTTTASDMGFGQQGGMTGGFGANASNSTQLGGLGGLSSLLKGAPYPTASETANSSAVNPNKNFGSFSSPYSGYSDFGKGMGGVGAGGGGSSMNLGNLSVNFNPSGGSGMSFAKGGEVPSSGGLKSLAKELPNYGRYNDDMVAHISSDEARLLKSLGGAGTINPVTGLPEYGLKKAWKNTVGRVEDIAKPITKPITDAVKPILPYVQYIAPFIPGVNAAYAAAMGALGSGFAGGGGFNFKRGLMGGMTAYGLSNLYAGMQAAGGGVPGSASGPMELGVTGTELAPTTVAQTGLTVPPGAAGADVGGQIMAGDFSNAASTIGENVSQGISNAYNTVTNPNTYANMGDKFTTQMGDAGQGLKNLAGLGEGTMADAAKAVGSQFGTGSAMGIYGGVTGAQALDEMDEAKLQADLANAKSKAEYDDIMARIEASKQRGIEAMRRNPYQFAYGGSVDDETGFDDFNNYMGGGIASMAKGGMAPRFLSGGGDGMSDDIKATINGKQPARLADGEFVVPADVVSHLGNGSSKAGAKKLYSMMDRVRHARTGNKKQGKQINPNKFLLA